MSGNGHAVLILPILDLNLPVVQLVNTMENSCPARWYCGAAHASAATTTCDTRTEISFIPTHAGNSWASAWPEMYRTFMNSNQGFWKPLEAISDHRLLEARGQLHQAVQLLTAAGISFVEHKPDDSHTALLWDSKTNIFLSQPFGPDNTFQLGLSPRDLTCCVFHKHEMLLKLKLNGTTLNQVASDLQFFLEDHGLTRNVFSLEKHFELPDYPDRGSSPFDTSDQLAFDVLSSAYTNAYLIMNKIALDDSRAGTLLTWPHHFDMAILITPGEGKSIGVGMSPGDASYTAPYYYVNVWPYPSDDQINEKPLTLGKWHTKDWKGMVLPLDQIVQEEEPEAQKSIVETFLQESIQHAANITE